MPLKEVPAVQIGQWKKQLLQGSPEVFQTHPSLGCLQEAPRLSASSLEGLTHAAEEEPELSVDLIRRVCEGQTLKELDDKLDQIDSARKSGARPCKT